MISRLACTKCNGQVMERDGLDGAEKLCLNCGFSQIPNIIPNEVLANDSEDYQLRNRSDGWSDTYYDLKSPYGIRKERGQTVRTNRLGTRRNWNEKRKYEQQKRRQKVTTEDIKAWNKLSKELTLDRKTST